MYTAVSAMGVRFGVGKRWEEINLANFTVAQLVTTFRRWQVTLTVPSAPTVMLYLDGEVVRRNWPNETVTFPQLLVNLGNAALPTTLTGLKLNLRQARFKDAFKAGYTVTPVTHANNDNPSIALEDKHDIRLTRRLPATDYTNFFKRYMVSINGFYHQTDTDGVNGIVVTDAMKSQRHSGQNQIGLFNFQKMGDLEFVPVTNAMIDVVDAGEARVTLGKNLDGKTVFLVLGGYFMTVDPHHFSRIGDSSYLIDFNNLPMRDRWFESTKYLDLRDLPVDTTPANDQQILDANLVSEAFIRAYLQISQSFFVILDNPEVFVNRQFIKRSYFPNHYVAYSEPVYPIVTGLGRMPEYWSVYEDRQWSLTVYDNVVAQRIFNTVNQNALVSVDDHNNPMYRGEVSMAYFMEIGSDV